MAAKTNKQEQPKALGEEGDFTAEDDAALKEYTMDEIAKHNTEEDLWVVIHGRVFNVTEFQIDHPGGPDVLQDVARQDATEQFEDILHTAKARKMTRKYCIGKVKGGKLTTMKLEEEKPPQPADDGWYCSIL